MSAPLLWLIAGLTLCLLELFVPTAFVELTMGISAVLVACVAWFVPSLVVQVVLWLLLSVVLTLLLRRFMPKSKQRSLEETREARTLTAILPGQPGRVIYEGNSWQARCEDEQVTIAPEQKVYVVGRQGTTLLIIPMDAIRF
jgi:membrane protein implicated in regulation of membrane protease activity